ncbi:RNA polymerase sigma factor [Anaerolentibacter hominis]|uniref:RNA polymerase sigma factor n=1 Tax=Anaerolentibacter hominis TaxID=3079009 RepID=UPI0031B813DE
MTEFEELYARYFPEVYRYIFSLCRDPYIAEEIAQETFFKALRSIGGFRGDCRLDVWLCQIARNTYFTELEKSKKRGKREPEEVQDTSPAPEQLLADREQAEKIHAILHRMEEPYKEVFMLRVFGELSFRQISGLFGKTESWARVTFYRAKKKIREELE